MNILHLLSQNHLTGAEVYACTLAEVQIASGHRVYQVSNGFYYPSLAIKLNLEVETKSRVTFVKSVLWLRNYIRKQNIHVIHTHSRAAAKVAYWATLGTGVAVASTVHGVQHPSFSKKLHNQYGEFIVAVCANIKNHLIADFGYKSSRIRVLPNPVAPEKYYFVSRVSSDSGIKRIAIIGRTTGPKARRTEQVIKTLLDENFAIQISLLGGSLADLNLTAAIKSKVIEIPHGELNSAVYAEYDLIVGSGRVAIEALITGVPVIAFGEATYVGLVSPANFAEACESNFGDIHPDSKEPVISVTRFLRDVQTEPCDLKELSLLAEERFSLEAISSDIQRLYESAYFLKNFSAWIPALMYHKIPETEIQSQHKIFVTRENFEKHLRFFKSRGFTTLTFSQLEKFRKAELSFRDFPKKPLLLTFDDGYRDNLENASPLLKKYGFKAQLFLLANSLINQNSWDVGSTEPAHEIVSGADRKLWLSSQFEIGSHGFSHEKITSLDSASVFKELRESKASLELEFQVPVNSFAFTYGITSEEGTRLAARAGYSYALNTDSGAMLMEEDPYSIFRVNIFPDEDFWSLLKKTSSWYRRYYRFKRRK